MPTDGNLSKSSEKMVKISYSCCVSKVSQLEEKKRSLSIVSLLLKILFLKFRLYLAKFFPFTKV